MFEILTFYIKLVAFSCSLNLGFSLKIARNTRLGERVCSLEDAMRMVKIYNNFLLNLKMQESSALCNPSKQCERS